MRFVWDEAKRKSNLAKHGLDFADAHRVFDGAVALQPDRRFDYGEERMLAAGMLDGFVVIVVHMESDDTIRIISMRKGTKNEANFYFENIGND
jgi:uncharacterized DUF497 family protein